MNADAEGGPPAEAAEGGPPVSGGKETDALGLERI